MITPEYQKQLLGMHKASPDKKWGTTGGRNFGARLVDFLEQRPNIHTVLDFGAGQKTLEDYVKQHPVYERLKWTNYDPGIPRLRREPIGKFHLVVSSDVLEHIEPDQIQNVLAWLDNRTKLYQYHLISCSTGGGRLPDGRDSHLLVESPEWWKDKFTPFGTMMYWASELVLKRGKLRRYCCIQIDKVG